MTSLGFRHEETRDGLTMLVQGSTGWDHFVASPGGTAYNMKMRTLGCVVGVFRGWNYNKDPFGHLSLILSRKPRTTFTAESFLV